MPRFMATKTGRVHVFGTTGPCPVARMNSRHPNWKGKKGLSPEAALDLDDCKKCQTHAAAKEAIKENRRAAKLAGKPAPPRVVAKKATPKPVPANESKGERLAREHAELAEANGWTAEVLHPADDEWVVIARQDDCVARVAWKGNTVNYPMVTATFPTHEFYLKHTAQFRRQVTLPPKERPAQPTPPVKRAPKRAAVVAYAETNNTEVVVVPEETGPAYNISNLPFARDDEDTVIIDILKGQTLYWRNTLAERVEHAQLPSSTKTIRISEHPRTGRRILSFPESHGWDAQTATEVLGAERSVALDQMIRLR